MKQVSMVALRACSFKRFSVGSKPPHSDFDRLRIEQVAILALDVFIGVNVFCIWIITPWGDGINNLKWTNPTSVKQALPFEYMTNRVSEQVVSKPPAVRRLHRRSGFSIPGCSFYEFLFGPPPLWEQFCLEHWTSMKWTSVWLDLGNLRCIPLFLGMVWLNLGLDAMIL